MLLTGGRDSLLSNLVLRSQPLEARERLREYMNWFGMDSVYVELQQNYLCGDTRRNRRLYEVSPATAACPWSRRTTRYITLRSGTGSSMRSSQPRTTRQ